MSPAKTAAPIELPFALRTGGPGEPCIRWGPWEGANFGGRMGVPLLSIENSTVICAKTAEPIGMPFGLWAQMGRRNRAGWGSIDAEGRCHGNPLLPVDVLAIIQPKL